MEDIDQRAFISEHFAHPASSKRPSMQMVSCGKPLPNTEIRIVDDAGRELPERHVGEIVLRSDCLFSEYFHRPDVTQKAFTSDG